MKIWVFAESENSNPTTATLEMVTKARELGATVEAVYVGTDADAVATGLGEYGVSKVHAVDPLRPARHGHCRQWRDEVPHRRHVLGMQQSVG